MALPSPLPDDPRKWNGWKSFDSANLYERLCLSFEENPSDGQIDEHCRQLLAWWQKKLPLKNQPSNPLAQLLRHALDEAPIKISEARTGLLDPAVRSQIDVKLRERFREQAVEELKKFIGFALGGGVLTLDAEENLLRLGQQQGLDAPDIKQVIEDQLVSHSARRESELLPPPPVFSPSAAQAAGAVILGMPAASSAVAAPPVAEKAANLDPADDFRRMLRLSGLDAIEMTDDQRDAFINMAENLGLEPGFAEDLVDEFLEESEEKMMSAPAVPKAQVTRVIPKGTAPAAPAAAPAAQKVTHLQPAPVSDLTPAQERAKFLPFSNTLGQPMILIPSGSFVMGNSEAGAPANEKPATKVTLTRFYMAKYPVTNAQFELFDPSHRAKRGPWAGDKHPVIYVSSLDAMRFCEWLSAREKKSYRLPTEAEWEYAARGTDGRRYPWGQMSRRGDLANFADSRTKFAWSDTAIDDGYAETSPIGSYPRGASSFGIEDMAGNVWEWCLDYFEPYKGGERQNPRGPKSGAKRVYRGGSWKSRFDSLRATCRSSNAPAYFCNDVGFRIICAAV